MKSCFLRARRGVLVEHVVEVGEIGDLDPRRAGGGLDARRAVPGEGRAQVEGVGDRIEHGLRRDVRLGRVERGGELDRVGVELAREGEPLLDREVGVGVTPFAGRELLQRRGEDADRHELGLE